MDLASEAARQQSCCAGASPGAPSNRRMPASAAEEAPGAHRIVKDHADGGGWEHLAGGDQNASDGFPEQGDVRVSRRQFIRGAAVLSARRPLAGLVGMTRHLALSGSPCRCEGSRPPTHAMVTDTPPKRWRLQPFTNERMVSEALSMAADEQPDLFLFGGD